MPRALCVFFVIFLISCTGNKENTIKDHFVIKSESFKTRIGNKNVYGVQLLFYSPEQIKQNKIYLVNLYKKDKVWIDTLYVELSPLDTLESEIIFTEAIAEDDSPVSFKIQAIDTK